MIENPENTTSVYSSALADAWMFVNSYALFDRLIHKGPLKLRHEKVFRDFKALAEPIRNCRNYHFHLEAENHYKNSKDSQVMGNLSWVNKDGKCIIVVPKNNLRGRRVSGLIFDTKKESYSSRLSLLFNSIQIDFDHYYAHIQKIKDELVNHFQNDLIYKIFSDVSFLPIEVEFSRQ